VFILYGTALATESGAVLFFEDLYGQDAPLLAKIAARGALLRRTS
jgi:murein L,D-transpeptidase YcbB/YkuD